MERPPGARIPQTVLLYAGSAWVIVQVVGFFVSNYELSRKLLDVAVWLLAVGLPAAVAFAWFHGARGRQRPRRIEAILLAAFLLAGGIGSWRIATAVEPGELAAAPAGPYDLGENSIAVLPFRHSFEDPEMEWLGSGLAELLTTDLAQVESLRVVSGQRLFDLLRQASTFALAQAKLAQVEISLGNVSPALAALGAAERHLTAAPARDRLLIEAIGEVFRSDLPAAERRLRELIDRYPQDKDARLWLWRILAWQGGREAEVRAVLEGLLALDPLYAPAYNVLAYHYLGLGDVRTADSLARVYVRLEPDEPNPRDTRGEILETAGLFEEARAEYREALAIDPTFIPSLDHLARSYLRQDDPEGLRRELSRRLSHPELGARARLLVGDGRAWEGHFQTAMQSYRAAAEAAADAGSRETRVEALGALAETALLVGDHAASARAVADMRREEPMNFEALAVTLLSLGLRGEFEHMEALKEQVVAAVQHAPGSPPGMAAALESYIASEIDAYAGRYETAVRRWRLSIEAGGLGPSPVWSPTMVRSLVELGRAEEATARAAELLEAVESEGHRLEPVRWHLATYLVGRAAELSGDPAAAEGAYARLVDHWGAAGLDSLAILSDAGERLARLRR